MPHSSRYWRLDNRPTGSITDDTLSLQTAQLPALDDGHLLVKNLYLSLDATNRLWMGEVPDLYIEPVDVGAPMLGFTVAEVLQSQSDDFQVGDLVVGIGTWSDYQQCAAASVQKFVLPEGIPLADAFGVLTVAGPTAYFGLYDVGKPRAGETVVVSAAAGAVGCLVGQIALMKGCRVIGIAGSEAKCTWLTQELGFHQAINYKQQNILTSLREACPDGVDLYFENVGGDSLDAAMKVMNLQGRIVICGLISMYNGSGEVQGPAHFQNLIMKRLTVQGFVVLDYAERFEEARSVLVRWMKLGKLKYRLDIMSGIENAVTALMKLYDGSNNGKMMVKIGDRSQGD